MENVPFIFALAQLPLVINAFSRHVKVAFCSNVGAVTSAPA